jgi:hypothetical protein
LKSELENLAMRLGTRRLQYMMMYLGMYSNGWEKKVSDL